MDTNSMKTPNKVVNSSPTLRFFNGQKMLPLTPKNSTQGSLTVTPSNLNRKTSHKFTSILNHVISTPPSRLLRVINPFEAALTERLHLPIINSPSLFHRPSTPQHSSTQFEWTIDEVSSLNPANVEAHETQFISITDPEVESKAQAAISSYFREKLIVPSPIDCPLRNQKIILNQALTTIGKKRKRNAICQTELTLPPNLSKELEEALKPYFTYTMNQQQSPLKAGEDCDTTVDHDARDASLRRKLFKTSVSSASSYDDDISIDLKGLSPAPQSPEIESTKLYSRTFQSPYTTFNRSLRKPSSVSPNLFGSLSPIGNEKSFIDTFSKSCEKSAASSSLSSHHCSTSSIYRSTPDRASASILRSSSSNSINMSIDCSAKSIFGKRKSLSQSLHFNDMEIQDEKYRSASSGDLNEFELCDENCIMSNSQSSNGSSQHPETPTRRSKYRIANRKNLSLSFSSCVQNDEDDNAMIEGSPLAPKLTQSQEQPVLHSENKTVLSKTDSGFNDMEE